MNIKEIKEMISLMNENGLVELEIEKDNTRIRLKKGPSGYEVLNEPLMVKRESGPSALVRDSASEEIESSGIKTVEIRAPMVGTFYRAPSPEAAPYVEIGQEIEPGQVVCVIEAMKLMNEIKAEVKGKIVDIQVDNAEPVEFGQVLFVIEPPA